MPIGQFREEWRIRRGIAQLSVGGGVARQSYLQKIIAMFGTSLIGYWPGNEEAGTVAVDYSGNGYNGVYTGVTLGQEGIGDGLTCPLYDGANDFMQPPVGFRTAWNGLEFSMGGWFQTTAWTDGVARNLFKVEVDGNNFIRVFKSTANNRISIRYSAGAATSNKDIDISPSIFFHFMVVVSRSGNYLRGYINGVASGADVTIGGDWVGTPAAATTVIGAGSATPGSVWSGLIAHVPVLSRAATSAEVAMMGL